MTTVENPSSKRRIEYLDVSRGLACLLVFFYHTAVNITVFGVPFYGYHGVHLFFVLSGYLLAGKFVPALVGIAPLPSVKGYLRSRFLRIYPPYLVCLAVFVLLRVASGTNVPDWENVVLRAVLLFNYVDRYDYFAINGGFWSLAVEMQFYLLLPLAVWLVMRLLPAGTPRAIWFAVFFIGLGVVSRIFEVAYIDHDHPSAVAHIRFKWATSHLDLFGVGILLRVFEDVICGRRFSIGGFGAVFGMTGGFAMLSLVALWTKQAGHWQDSKDLAFVALGPLLACLGFAVLLGTTGASSLRDSRFFRSALLVGIGQISYSLYLYHPGVFFVFNRLSRPDQWGLSWGSMTMLIGLCCLPVTLLVAWIAYRLVERPFIRVPQLQPNLPSKAGLPQCKAE